MVPSIEMVRFVNSGTEATMSAVRLARAATGRARIVKFDGGYHGHADGLLVAAGSGVATLGIAGSPGVPDAVAALTTVVAVQRRSPRVEEAFRRFPGEIAAFIVEPVAGNMGVRPAAPGYLEAAARRSPTGTARCSSSTRSSPASASPAAARRSSSASRPDLTCLGKIIGGGLPVGAYGGRRELMEQMAPSGPVYQAGTLSGNPLAMAAGIAMLREIDRRPPYAELERKGALLEAALREAIRDLGADGAGDATAARIALDALLRAGTDRRLRRRERSRHGRATRFLPRDRERGVFLPPAQFEAWFVSTAHTDADSGGRPAPSEKPWGEISGVSGRPAARLRRRAIRLW